jgi:hypothetical protein
MKKLMLAVAFVSFFSFSTYADILTPPPPILYRKERPQASEVKVVIPDLFSEDAASLVSGDVESGDPIAEENTR